MAHPVHVSMEEWPQAEASFLLTFETVKPFLLENVVDQLCCLSFLILLRLERS